MHSISRPPSTTIVQHLSRLPFLAVNAEPFVAVSMLSVIRHIYLPFVGHVIYSLLAFV